MIAQSKHNCLLTFLPQAFARNNSIPETIKSLFLFCYILTISFCTTNAFGQFTYELDKTTRFEKMGAEEGLSTGFTICMHQDKYGFIWIGTQNGLNLYDGYKVKVFSANPRNPQSLYNNYINSIFEEADGTMWFCTSKGISKYKRSNQTFNNYFPDSLNLNNDINTTARMVQDGDYLWIGVLGDLLRFNKQTAEFSSFGKNTLNPSKGLNGTYLTDGIIDGTGVMWVGSSEPGDGFALNRFNKETETFTHFKNDPSIPESFVGKQIISMIEDYEGTIWFATRGGGLIEVIDKEKGNFRQYTHSDSDPNSLLNDNLNVVFEDAKGNIWTGGTDGFSKLIKNTTQFTNYKIPPFSFNHSRSNYIRAITEDDKGELWLVSYDGLFRFDPYSNNLRHYLHNPEIKNSLSNDKTIQTLHERSGQDWVLTWNDGICKINHFSNSFQKAETNSHDNNALSGNFIQGILGDSKGNLWIGTYRKGLNKTRLNKTRNFSDFEHYVVEPGNPNSLNNNIIFTINEDKEQTIWIGTDHGLNRYNESDNNFTRFEHDPDDSTSISNGIVDVVFEDSHGTFWVGTRNGLNIMDRETGKFLHFVPDKNKPGAIASYEVRAIHEDNYGDIWFGGDFLEKLNRKDTSFINYFSDTIVFRDFEKSLIWNMIEDDSANLWMATYRGGIIKFQRNDETFVSITTDHGLPSNTITAIEIDDNGYIWASTIQGLSRIDPADYSIRNYDEADGLGNREFINNSSCKDKDGWLYFGGRNGFTYFHPDSIKENKFIPPVYITSLNVAGEPKYFDKPLYELEKIELQHNENDFSFDFVALNYINSQKNQYAYKLEGYDEDWNHVGNKHEANYTNMSPGEYTFRVKASNNDGYWNEEGASLTMLIHPPFWKTWWAYVIYTFVFLGMVYLIRRNELRKINLRQELELEHVQAEQLAELDVEKNKFFSNISHEFRTPLTLILGPLERIITGKKEGQEKEQLNLVKRNARRLQTLITQLLSLSKLESGKMKLRARPENIVKLTQLFLQSFHSMAEDKGIQLEFKSTSEEYIVYIDTIKFEKVTNNLLSNAFKFTERGGKIKVSITLIEEKREVAIKFSDTGSGIQKEELPHVFDRFYQVDEKQMKTKLGTGIGLALTKELIELHHGNITVESEFEMGTTFTVFLPTGKDHLSEEEIIVRKDSNGETSKNGSESDDDLLNDDYLFVQDVVTKSELTTEIPEDSNLPLLLIVEDNDDMRAYIKSYLSGSYYIIEAADGKEGAEQAIEHIPDLIVSDLMMPKLDGNEMTLMLKTDERTSHIPIILLTAKASKESKLEGLETGADDFLTKPFDADELLVRIKNLIEQRKKLSVMLSQHIGDVSQTRIIKESAGKAMSKMDEEFLGRAKDIIDADMADPDFSVEVFAEKIAMTRMQLHRKLRSLTDNSARDFLRNIRMIKAAELLKEGDLNVTQISYEIGILSLSNFAKSFKEKYGVNPSEYK